jgi:hypothetical protein
MERPIDEYLDLVDENMLTQQILCTVCYILMVVPGIGFYLVFDQKSDLIRRLALGNLTGLGTAICFGYYCLFFGIPFSYFLPLEYAGLLLLLFLWRKRTLSHSTVLSRKQGLCLLFFLFLVFAGRAIPPFFNEVPPGTDPCFHTLIAKKILLTGELPRDWTPFEAVALNYPIGSHILIAQIAHYTEIPVHTVFKAIFPILASLTSLSIFSLGLSLVGSFQGAFYSALAYSFLALWGSLDYYRWGGLPNLLGMLFLLGLVELVVAEKDKASSLVFGLLFAAQLISHHHSSLCTVFLFLCYPLFSFVCARKLTALSRTVLRGLAAACPLVLLPLASQFSHAYGEVGKTSVLKFYEERLRIWDCLLDLGVPLVLLGVIGLYYLFRNITNEPSLFLVFWTAAFFVLFVYFEYVYRLAVFVLYDEFYTAFTPSRFITNLAYPLAILAGVSLTWIAAKIRWSAFSSLVFLGALVWAFFPLRSQTSEISLELPAWNWIAKNTERNAFVVSTSLWAPYFTWREGPFTPLPASEARNDAHVRYKREVLTNDLSAILDFHKQSRRPVYIDIPVGAPALPGLREVFRDERTKIYKP